LGGFAAQFMQGKNLFPSVNGMPISWFVVPSSACWIFSSSFVLFSRSQVTDLNLQVQDPSARKTRLPCFMFFTIDLRSVVAALLSVPFPF